MNNSISLHRTLSLALAFAGVFIASNLAVAQVTTEEIVVRAPIERSVVKSSPGSVAKSEIIELNRYVSITDLDLTNVEDLAELDTRIVAVAKESCQNLSDMFPLERSDPLEMNRCVKKAVSGAEKRKQRAIAAGH